MAGSTRLGDDLRAARRAAGLTQVKLAIRLGVDPGAVSGWERGIRMPDDQNREIIADFLGLTIADYLVKYEATSDGSTGRRSRPSPPAGENGAQANQVEALTRELVERLERVEKLLGEQQGAPPRRARGSR